MLVDKEVGMTVAGDTDHAVVKVLDPTLDGFSIAELYADADLTITERAKIQRLLPGVAWRRRSRAAQM
jgi:hypothetical protein